MISPFANIFHRVKAHVELSIVADIVFPPLDGVIQ